MAEVESESALVKHFSSKKTHYLCIFLVVIFTFVLAAAAVVFYYLPWIISNVDSVLNIDQSSRIARARSSTVVIPGDIVARKRSSGCLTTYNASTYCCNPGQIISFAVGTKNTFNAAMQSISSTLNCDVLCFQNQASSPSVTYTGESITTGNFKLYQDTNGYHIIENMDPGCTDSLVHMSNPSKSVLYMTGDSDEDGVHFRTITSIAPGNHAILPIKNFALFYNPDQSNPQRKKKRCFWCLSAVEATFEVIQTIGEVVA